jgi:uncharacterized protein YbjT (DUF2867 family)
MSKLITVFGCTGNQGGSVVKYILQDKQLAKEYRIRGVTRDTTKKSAQDLAKQGVELVTVCFLFLLHCRSSSYRRLKGISNANTHTRNDQADLNSTSSLSNALTGSHTVFLVTNYWETTDGELEYHQGKNVTDVAKEVGVSRIIFSSLLHVTEESKGRLTHVPHFDSKANIEKYIRASGLDCTFFLPGYYMSNFKTMLRKADDGTFQLFYPVSEDAKFPLFDAVNDTGMSSCSLRAFCHVLLSILAATLRF